MEKVAELRTLDEVVKSMPDLKLPDLKLPDLTEPQVDKDFIAKFASELIDGVLAKQRLGEQLSYPKGSSPSPESVSTAEVIEKFLESKKSSVAETSVISYKGTLNPFAKRYPRLPLTPQEIESYLSSKGKRTAAGAYTVLRMLYEFANHRFGVPNAMEQVQRPRFKEKEPAWLTLEESRLVVEACRDDRDLALTHLYEGHGLRLDEACRINIGDIEDGQLLVRGKERTEYIPLLPETKEILLRLANGRGHDQPLFVSKHRKRMSHKQTYNVVKAILNRAGVTKSKSSQRIATHTLRKTFATLAYHAGRERKMVERLLRHRKRDVGDLYIGMPMDMLKEYLERYSPIRLLNGQPKQELHKIFSCSKLPPFSIG